MSRRWTILRTELFTKGYVEPLKNYIGIPNRELLVTKELETSSLYNSLDSMNEISLALLNKLKNDKDFGLRIYKDCIKSCEYLVQVSKDVSQGNFKSLSSQTLVKIFDIYVDTALNFTPFLALPPNYEMYIIDEINQSLVEKVGDSKSEEYLQKLMSLKEYPFQMLEQIDLANIALRIKLKTDINKALIVHKRKYQWLSCYNFDEVEFSLEDFKKRLEILQELSFSELSNKVNCMIEKLNSDKNEFQRVINKLGLSNGLINKIKLLREFVFLRTYRIEMNSQSNFYLKPLLREISERGNISVRQLAMMLSDEIKTMLLEGKVPNSVNFKDREKYAVFWLHNAKYHYAFGSKAKKVISKQIVDVKKGNQALFVKGTTASLGKIITGNVRLVNKHNMSEFKKGEILVTTMTSPELVPAMHKAAGIVTDEGGVTCHAAIVSREFNIPCIVGTGNATKVFKDGDFIEVNTEFATAKII